MDILTEKITNLPSKKEFEKFLDFYEKNSYTKDDIIERYILGKKLEQLGGQLVNRYKKEITEIIKEEEEVDGVRITPVISNEYDYLGDAILSKYEERIEELKESLKEMVQSVKNRQEKLIDDNKAIVSSIKKTIRVYL
jgi:hypothetical protein